jgi:hypothetical protein
MEGLDSAVRQQIEDAINAALTEAKSGNPDAKKIKTRLETAADTMKSAAGLAESGQKVAEVLLAIGKWAVLFLA